MENFLLTGGKTINDIFLLGADMWPFLKWWLLIFALNGGCLSLL